MATPAEVCSGIFLAQGIQLTSTNREWVAKCLGQITESNRSEVQAELKQVISEAFAAQTLWSTDWSGTQLKRLLFFAIVPPSRISTQTLLHAACCPNPHLSIITLSARGEHINVLRPPTLTQRSTHSIETPTINNKKAKKNLSKNSTTTYVTDLNDQAALNRRAQRFQREHELERTKGTRNGNQTFDSNPHRAHLFQNQIAGSRSGSPYTASDQPEADPVSVNHSAYPHSRSKLV
jgi:hypothetical protein